MKRLKMIVAAVLAIAVVVVVLQNVHPVGVTLLFVSRSLSLALLLIVTLLVGFAIGLLVASNLARKGRGGKK